MVKKKDNVAFNLGEGSTKNPFDDLQFREHYTRLPIMPDYPRKKPQKQGGYGYAELLNEAYGEEPIIVDDIG